MRRLAVVAIFSVAVLAGCIGGNDGGNKPSPTATGSSSGNTATGAPPPPLQMLDLLLAFEFTSCQGLSVQHSRPLADVQTLLPEGFTAAPGPDAVSPNTGVLGIDLLLCGNLTTAAVAVPNTYIGLVYTYVQQPVDRVPGAPDSPVQEYLFRMLAGEDVLALLWPAAGYDTYNGSANVNVGPPADGPDALLRIGQGSVGSGYLLVAGGATAAPLSGGRTQAFARYTVLNDDESILLWTGTYDFPRAANGPGSAEVADDDPFARYATAGRPTLQGVAKQFEAGAVRGQDLRRIFTSAD